MRYLAIRSLGLGIFAATVALALTSAGCSQPTNITPDPDLAIPIPKDALDLNVGSITVGPGMERTVCVTAQVPIGTPVDIIQIATRQVSSHHVIFYKFESGAAPTVNQTPQDCPPLDLLSGGGIKAPLFIGESSDPAQNVLQLPPGVAYHFEPGDFYRTEVHVVNATPNTLTAAVDVFLSPAAPSAQVIYADMLFFNNVSGLGKSYDGTKGGLPPMTKTTIDPAFSTVDPSMKVFAATTHQHHLGTSISVQKSSGAMDQGAQLLTNTDWQHPNLLRIPDASPLTFQTGEGLRWVCSYDNTTTGYVKFGESGLTDEMCIIWGYYYPSQGFKVIFL